MLTALQRPPGHPPCSAVGRRHPTSPMQKLRLEPHERFAHGKGQELKVRAVPACGLLRHEADGWKRLEKDG